MQAIRDVTPENSAKITISDESGHTGVLTCNMLLRFLNRAQKRIQQRLLAADDTLFMTYSTANSVANQVSYTMPTDCLGKRIRYLEIQTTTGIWVPYYPADISDRDKYSSDDALINYLIDRYGLDYNMFYLLDNDIFVLPKISYAGTANIRIHYTKRLADLDFGTVAAGAATSITLASTASITADYYNGYNVTLINSSGLSVETKAVTDYSVVRVCTTATWTTTPTTSYYYGIECEMGDYEELVILKVQEWALKAFGLQDDAINARQDYAEALFNVISNLTDGRTGGPHYMHSSE